MDTSTGILIFTEHPHSGKALSAVLGKLGFSRVFVVGQPHEAIKVLAGGGIGLVTVDHAPGSSQTVSLIRALRDVGRFKGIPLLLLAEPGEKGLAAFAQKDAAAVFVSKPLAAKPFAAGLQQLLGGETPRPPAPAARPAPQAQPQQPQQPKPAVQAAPRPQPAPSPAPSAPGVVSIQDLARLLKARKTVEAAALAENMLKTQGARPDLYLVLALARLMAGDQARCLAAIECVIERCGAECPQPVRAPAPDMTPPGVVRGIWSSLSMPERRQKAFEHFSPSHDNRSSFRLFAPDWSIGIAGREGRLQVVDLSFGGCCFEAPRPAVERGTEMIMDLYQGKDIILSGVTATILRVESEVVGCKFGELNRHQESLLNQKLREEQTKGATLSTEFDVAGKKEKKVIKLSL